MPKAHSDVILERLMSLHPKVIDLSLDRMYSILGKLGNPQNKLPPVIHVAGTNGKGSLLAYLKAMLEAAGYSVHCYTSPHLVRFAERIVLNGKIIDEASLSELLLKCEETNGTEPITYFEITTAAAFKAFADHPADILLLETGLGGRLDATNVVDQPAITAITPISHDHEQFLGSDLRGIAFEKAGIIKEGIPLVIGPQSDVASSALNEKAEEKQASPYQHDKHWTARSKTSGDWEYTGDHLSGTYRLPALVGSHQIFNAGTAIAVLEKLKGFSISKEHISKGLDTVTWPARLQKLDLKDLDFDLPQTTEVWLDGGHNEAAGEQLAKHFCQKADEDGLATYVISGMLDTKDQTSFFRHLQKFTKQALTIPIEGEMATTDAKTLSEMAKSVGISCEAATSFEAAIDQMRPLLERAPCRLLITGSLYLAGHILRTQLKA